MPGTAEGARKARAAARAKKPRRSVVAVLKAVERAIDGVESFLREYEPEEYTDEKLYAASSAFARLVQALTQASLAYGRLISVGELEDRVEVLGAAVAELRDKASGTRINA